MRRAEHLEAAVAAVRRLGPEASMAEIADEAGISKPVLYDHFGDRSGLTVAIAERAIWQLARDMVHTVDLGAEPVDMLAQAFDVFVALIESEPEVYRFLLRGARGLGSSLGELPGVLDGGTRLATLIGSAFRAAGADSGPAEPYAFGILGFVFAAGEW